MRDDQHHAQVESGDDGSPPDPSQIAEGIRELAQALDAIQADAYYQAVNALHEVGGTVYDLESQAVTRARRELSGIERTIRDMTVDAGAQVFAELDGLQEVLTEAPPAIRRIETGLRSPSMASGSNGNDGASAQDEPKEDPCIDGSRPPCEEPPPIGEPPPGGFTNFCIDEYRTPNLPYRYCWSVSNCEDAAQPAPPGYEWFSRSSSSWRTREEAEEAAAAMYGFPACADLPPYAGDPPPVGIPPPGGEPPPGVCEPRWQLWHVRDSSGRSITCECQIDTDPPREPPWQLHSTHESQEVCFRAAEQLCPPTEPPGEPPPPGECPPPVACPPCVVPPPGEPPPGGEPPPVGVPPPGGIPPPGGGMCEFEWGIWPRWNLPEVCQQLQGLIDQLGSTPGMTLACILGLRNVEGRGRSPAWVKFLVDTAIYPLHGICLLAGFLPGVGDDAKELCSTIVRGFEVSGRIKADEFFRALADWIDSLLGDKVLNPDCNPLLMIWPSLAKGILSIIQSWLGIDLGDTRQTISYVGNFLCPTLIPSTAEANVAFLAGKINADTWRCWVRANNDWEYPASLVRDSQRSRPNDNDVVALTLRGELDPEQFQQRMRELGYLSPDEAAEKLRLADYIPSPSELVPWMVRDVFDPEVVAEFQLDAEFEQKFQGKIVSWAQANGMSEETFRYNWRAHWDFPSPTQLFVMLHRLRPGDVDPEIEVTEAMVDRALAVNDMNPTWRARMMAISYAPLTRVDTQRAFFIGAINERQVYKSYRDQGYNDENATILVDFTKVLKRRRPENAPNGWSVNRVVQLYRESQIGKVEATDALNQILGDLRQVNRLLDGADADNDAKAKGKCIEAVRKRFMLAEIDLPSAQDRLIQLQLDVSQANRLAMQWQCEFHLKQKQGTASLFCKWYKRGLLSANEFLLRLVRIGYMVVDAQRILGVCQAELVESDLRRAEQLERKRVQDLRRARQDAERAQGQARREQQGRERTAEQRAERERRRMEQQAERERKFMERSEKAYRQRCEADERRLERLRKQRDSFVARGQAPPIDVMQDIQRLEAAIDARRCRR